MARPRKGCARHARTNCIECKAAAHKRVRAKMAKPKQK